MKILMIDDAKSPVIFRNSKGERFKPHEVVLVKNYSDGMTALFEQGPWDVLLMDYNLNEFSPSRNGDAIIRRLIRVKPLVKHIILITADKDKAKEMTQTCEKLKAAQVIEDFSVQTP